jgi:hypothetical protein
MMGTCESRAVSEIGRGGAAVIVGANPLDLDDVEMTSPSTIGYGIWAIFIHSTVSMYILSVAVPFSISAHRS